MTILKSNIMQFGTRFYRQIKGTAMGTPMAVNFANIFMDKFERDMLESFEEKHGTRPAVWLRFIDDIFFIWEGDNQSLSQFIDHCNEFSKASDMSSSIKFTSSCSQSEVNFLDMTVRIEEGHLVTDLFTKAVDTHSYLHAKSFHPPTMISSLPKAQFIRIRRICTDISDYKRHATSFVRFFSQRGFKQDKVTKVAEEIATVDRETLLQPKRHPNHPSDDSNRVVLSLKWHPRLRFLPRLLHGLYDRYSAEYPNLKKTFIEPPIVAFRRNRTIRDTLVHSRTYPNQAQSPISTNQNSSARFSLSTAPTITNVNTGITINTLNNESTIHDNNVIYAAECTNCQQLYVGQTKQKIFERFRGHRSDTTLRPDRCELAQHFHNSPNGCSFENDLEIHVLQKNVRGSRCVREAEEDKWILKLGSLSPNGMNAKMSDYGCLYKSLF